MKRRFLSTLLKSITAAAILLLATNALAQDDGFVEMFNGKNLDGWEQAGGTAKYSIVDGAIVGESVPNTPNSFLCTQKIYHDFILEYEYKCDDSLNSGVQVRSNVYGIETYAQLPSGKKRRIPAGRVHGYQVEIDPNKPDRMWSGGIYDEARRGWLYPGIGGGNADEFTKVGQATYKPGQWNSVRVKIQGNRIQTWLNGEQRADFTDELTSHGIIALQVHGIGDRKESIGKKVMWRNLMIKEL